jgi:TonB family protein
MAEGYRTFGSYILFKELSADVLGHLYRAGEFDATGIKRTVFLRVLDSPRLAAHDVREGFAAGRQVASQLLATNVASGATFLQHDGVPAVAYDYLPAQPLNMVLERARSEGFPVPVDNALLVLEKLSLALSSALVLEFNGAPLVHGFVHPSLVLISTDGEAMITAFGIGDRLLAALDHPEVANHTDPYLAPEVILTHTPSRRADVYSLGAILLELLTGQPLPTAPPERLGVLDRAQLAYDDRPLPNDIKAVLARAIAPRPDDRFSSAADFKKELDRLLYGGAYSPTTFNLALFMDRLFRSEIELEERERSSERAVDVARYLMAEPPPAAEEPSTAPPSQRGRKGLWIGLAVTSAVLAAGAVTWFGILNRAPSRPELPPTPTAEEIEAERQQQEERLQRMVQEMVQEKMAEREQQIRAELLERQARIEDLQRRLRASEQRVKEAQPSPEEQQQQIALQRQIAAEEQAQLEQQEELEAERQRSTSDTVPPTTPELEPVGSPVPIEPPVRATATPLPTVTPLPSPTSVPVRRDSFFDPSEVDTLPTVLKEHPVTWSRLALHSRRQGLVIVQALVNADGRVEDVKVLRTDHEGFGIPQAVVDAVRKYHFKPATKSGVKVKSYATVTQRYRFRDR